MEYTTPLKLTFMMWATSPPSKVSANCSPMTPALATSTSQGPSSPSSSAMARPRPSRSVTSAVRQAAWPPWASSSSESS